MPLPEPFLDHLRARGYHPRSDRHSNALAEAIVADLMLRCEAMARDAAAGRLVYDLNMDLRFGTSTWNVDLVLGSPSPPTAPSPAPITRATPSAVRIAIEIKGVMTEHRKAVKNRKRDFEAHHEHVHNYNRHTIAGGVMVINSSPTFKSPLRPEITAHGSPNAVLTLVQHCVTEMRNVTEAGGGSPYGMDAKCALVVDFDNVHFASARYLTSPPAPQPGDPLHYESFLQRICDEYGERFG